MAHRGGIVDFSGSSASRYDLPTFPFLPKVIFWWTTGGTGTRGPGSGGSTSHGFAGLTAPSTVYQATHAIGSDLIVGRYDSSSLCEGQDLAPGVAPQVLFAGDTGSIGASIRWDNQLSTCVVSTNIDVYHNPTRLHYLALGGDTLDVAVGRLPIPSGGSSSSVTGLTFAPKFLRVIGAENLSGGAATYYSGLAADGSGQVACGINWTFNVAALQTNRTSAIIGAPGSDYLDVSAWNSDGFTVTSHGAGVPGAAYYVAMADSAGDFYVGDYAWVSGNSAITAPGFRAGVVLTQGTVDDENPAMSPFANSAGMMEGYGTLVGRRSAGTCFALGAENFGGGSGAQLLAREDAVAARTYAGSQPLIADASGFAVSGGSAPGGSAINLQYAALRLSSASKPDPCVKKKGWIARYA